LVSEPGGRLIEEMARGTRAGTTAHHGSLVGKGL
jgi:hypothetical protein